MKVGDKVRKRINTTAAKLGIGHVREDGTLHEGTIIYVHPLGRFLWWNLNLTRAAEKNAIA